MVDLQIQPELILVVVIILGGFIIVKKVVNLYMWVLGTPMNKLVMPLTHNG